MDTETCRGIIDQIAAAAPECLLILTGGEPLLRHDLEALCDYATKAGLWVVVGTNGTLLTARRAKALLAAGVKGVGISLDSLQPRAHDRFRGRDGAWREAVAGLETARAEGLDAVVQMSLFPWNEGELEAMAEFAEGRGARALNVYFLVCTGRGQTQTGLDAEATEAVYARLHKLQQHHAGRMLVNAKCAPQFQRFIHQTDPTSAHLRTFETGCPAGIHYARIGPTGTMTPCPYMPEAGEKLGDASLEDIWRNGEAFVRIRDRGALGGRCGLCEFRQACGGCRARALADHGDLLGEDPCCSYRPGVGGHPVQLPETALYGSSMDAPPLEGTDPEPGMPHVEWDAEALDQMRRIPPFVRGMVKRRMEQFARKQGKSRITADMMAAAKEKAATFLARRGIRGS
jgi:radical SAM protein with 4Fe4S-binding SPASM domain